MEPNQPLTAKQAALLGAQADRPPFNPEADKRHVIASTLRRLNEITGQGELRVESPIDPMPHQSAVRIQPQQGNTLISLPHSGDMTLRDTILADERQSSTTGPTRFLQSADRFSANKSTDAPPTPPSVFLMDSPVTDGTSIQQGWQDAGSGDSTGSPGISTNENAGRGKLLAGTSKQSANAISPVAPVAAAEISSVPPVGFRVELEPKPTDDSESSEDSSGTLDFSGSADESYDDAGDYSDTDSSPSEIDGPSPSRVTDSGDMANRPPNSVESADSEPRQVNVSVQVDVEVSVARLDKITDAATRKAGILAENLIDRKLSDERRDAFMRDASRRACM